MEYNITEKYFTEDTSGKQINRVEEFIHDIYQE